MRNFGIIVLILGLLLLILDTTIVLIIIRVSGALGVAFGLLSVFVPERAAELIEKFKSKKTDSK